MREVDDVYLQMQKKVITKEEACKKIMEMLYKFPFVFGLQSLSEDELMDFLIYQNPRTSQMIEKYDASKSSFTSYLYNHVEFTLSTWRKSRNLHNIMNSCLDESSTEYYFALEDDYSHHETKFFNKTFDEELLEVAHFKEEFSKDSSSSLKMIQEEGTLFSALKSCNSLSETMISKVSILSDKDEKQLRFYIKELQQQTKTKVERKNSLIEKRNRNYTYKIRYEHAYANKNINSLKRQEAKKKYEYYDEKLRKQNAKLTGTNGMTSPSNRQIAELLNIKERHVQYILKKYEENMDRISMKGYYESHENISCNR